MQEEGRILDTYKWEDFNLWKDDVFELKNFKPGQIKEFYDYAHEKIRDEVGPQPLQVMEIALNSYQRIKDRTDEFHAFQADRLRYMAMGAGVYVRAIKKYHHSAKVRERAAMLEKRVKKEIKPNPVIAAGFGVASRFVAGRSKNRVESTPTPIVSDPPPRWTYYNTFDDRVWVKRGRRAAKPEPYQDRGLLGMGKPLVRIANAFRS
jgi:hypothetical protein